MKLPISIVDAFTSKSETAFVVREAQAAFAIRWFSPSREIAFCGHATLATAQVIAAQALASFPIVLRAAAVGELYVARSADGSGFAMDLPAYPPQPVEAPPPALLDALSIAPQQVLRNMQAWIAVYANEGEVRELVVDLQRLKTLAPLDVAVTAPGDCHDFVSRYFWPANGGDEDPVTGSIHTALAPYWAARLGRSDLVALQASARSGLLRCRVEGDRVCIGGDAVHYLDGHIEI
jgi:PhzF family phenazine biosynthesis protein